MVYRYFHLSLVPLEGGISILDLEGGEVNSRCESILLPLIRKLKVACTLPAQRDSPSPIYFSIISGKKRQS